MHMNDTSVDDNKSYIDAHKITDRPCLFPTTSGWKNARPSVGPTISLIELKTNDVKTGRRSPVYNRVSRDSRTNCPQ
jgi:hypothetical protein